MPDPYTHMNLSEVKNMAPEFGYGELGEARFAQKALDAERTGVSHLKLKPGKRMPFGHKHDEAEEVYVIIAGSGRIKLDDEIIEVVEFDAIRIAPEVGRQVEGGPEGIEVLMVGPHYDKDGELLHGWWED